MEKFLKFYLIVLPAIVQLVACSGSSQQESTPGTYETMNYLSELAPVIDASMSVFKTQSEIKASISLGITKSIGPWNAPDLPASPQKLFEESYDPSTGYARYPAKDYLTDFYGEAGNWAYMKLSKAPDGWGDFKVTLYVYPTLSPSVRYTEEVYRVPADDWTCFVNRDKGVCDPIAFEEISTHYFDGRVEYRNLIWSRYVDDMVYDAAYFKMPDSFDDEAYTYPKEIADPATVPAKDNGELTEYASKEIFSVSAPDGCNVSEEKPCPAYPGSNFCYDVSGTEFYDLLVDDTGATTKYSKSYSTEHIVFKDGAKVENQIVRIYSIDPRDNKTVRGKTVTSYTWRGGTRVITMTEATDVHDNDDDGMTNYESAITAVPNADYATSEAHPIFKIQITLSLEENAKDSDEYTGTMTISKEAVIKKYKVALDALNGLKIVPADGEVSALVELLFPIDQVDHTATSVDARKIEAKFTDGSFEGMLEGGLVYGSFTNATGSVMDIVTSSYYSVLGYEDTRALLGKWKLDEGTGKIACDSVADNDGVIFGATWVNAASGYALNFDGIDDYVEIGHPDTYNIATGMSFATWVQTNENKTAKILEMGDWDGHGIYQDKWNGWKTAFRIKGVSESIDWGGKIPKLGTWYHVTGTYDGDYIKLYVDGALAASKQAAGTLDKNARPVNIGANTNQKFFNGTIDEAAIFNRALSAEEVLNIYTATLPQ